MTTIKLPYNSEFDFLNLLKQYSNVVRFSYNRLNEGTKQKEIRLQLKQLSNINELGSWIQQSAIMEAIQIKKRFKNEKVIFGGKFNFNLRIQSKINSKEFKLKRLLPLSCQGEKQFNGNRHFKLNLSENCIDFKLKKKLVKLQLPKLRPNIKKKLQLLEQLSNNKLATISYKLDLYNIYISFEEQVNLLDTLKQDKYLGIDLNPENIGISVHEGSKIISCKEFSVKQITDSIINSKLASSNPKIKHLQNKLNFETIEISKRIALISKENNCKFIFIEDLKFKPKVTNPYNHKGNRKNRNLWKRDKFINNLQKRCNEFGIKLFKVNPAYSSFIGNLKYNYSDAVNASLEIGRRGYNCIILKNKQFYPEFDKLSVKDQWKEHFTDCKDWKQLYLKIKNSKMRYRVSLQDASPSRVFSLNSKKSKVKFYNFADNLII